MLPAIIDAGPWDTGQACRAAGISPNRLALWHHRAAFQSDEDRAGDRIPGDPRQYSGADCTRMRLLALLSDHGVPMADAQPALRLFDQVGYREDLLFVLTRQRDGDPMEARAVRPAELQRVLVPADRRSRPRLAIVVDAQSVVDATELELNMIRAEQTTARMMREIPEGVRA